MLTRRQLLIAAAVSPIAQFCRTEPGYQIDHTQGVIEFMNSKPFDPDIWDVIDKVAAVHGRKSCVKFINGSVLTTFASQNGESVRGGDLRFLDY